MSEFELLDRKESLLRAEADVLDKEFEEIGRRRETIMGKLRRIAAVRADLRELLADGPGTVREGEEDSDAPEAGDEDAGDAPGPRTEPRASVAQEPDRAAQSPVEMEEARRRAVSLLATSGQKMRARAIAEAIGEDVSRPARVETTRGRLKTLVAEGALEEEPPGVFFIAVSGRLGDSGSGPEGAGRPREE
ncbi:hypothetical protein ABZX85_50435 [Streptomyces sp. NPDC004539]|uniref:hypothetical protein n=1 Tax=Streptomyces sp. NPDC004539 TaxID=3154280 RepID=UPI0033AA7F7C